MIECMRNAAKKPKSAVEENMVEVKGYLNDGYCPSCGACLEDMVPECPYCKISLNWDKWKQMNSMEE